jgi:predicted nuclease of predicted toxin-antitoxin system
MKILDESIPRMTVEALRNAGHDVKDVRGTSDCGVADSALWSMAIAESRLMVTTDKGFSVYRASTHSGILIVRLRQPNRHKIHHAIFQAMQNFRDKEWPNRLVVVRDKTMSTSRYTPS